MQEAIAPPPAAQRETLLRLDQVEATTGLKKSTIYSLIKAGKFVQPVRITARCTAWPESAIQRWVQDRIATANSKAV